MTDRQLAQAFLVDGFLCSIRSIHRNCNDLDALFAGSVDLFLDLGKEVLADRAMGAAVENDNGEVCRFRRLIATSLFR